MRTYLILTLFTILLSSSIQIKKKSVQEIDLTNYSGKYTLHLEELMTDVRVVRLPYSKDILVPGGFDAYISNNFIIIVSGGTALQFNGKGEFIRKLVSKGKGPGETTYISSFDVNDEETKFYIHPANNRGFLYVYDLSTGNHLPKIALPDNMLETFVNAGDHILWCESPYGGVAPKVYRQFLAMTFEGDIISVGWNSKMHRNDIIQGKMKYLKRVEEKVFFLDQICDTLFIINKAVPTALCFLRVKDRYNFKTNREGNLPLIDVLTENKIKLMNRRIDVKKAEGKMWSMGKNDYENFLWNLKSGEIKHIKAYYNDFFEMKVDELEFTSRAGVGFIKYDAIEFKELLTQALKNPQLSSKKREQLLELDREVSVEDNPIFLIGQVLPDR